MDFYLTSFFFLVDDDGENKTNEMYMTDEEYANCFEKPKVIEIIGIRKTLEWGFWWVWHFCYILSFKTTIKSVQNLWK